MHTRCRRRHAQPGQPIYSHNPSEPAGQTLNSSMQPANFQLVSKFSPAGDQPRAIDQLVSRLRDRPKAPGAHGRHRQRQDVHRGPRHRQARQADARPVAQQDARRPALQGVRGFFPRNAVHYFISYYDYYQPEAYIPQRDIYIEKDAAINENIDRLRLAATSALVSREDVIIVASVSCIYGLGSPDRLQAHDGLSEEGRHRRTRQAAAASSSISSTSATTSPSSAADSASAATWSRSGPPMRSSPCASSCSATRWTPWPSSIRPAAKRSAAGRTVHLPRQALRHARGAHQGRRRGHRAGARRTRSPSFASEGKLLEAQRLRPHALRHGNAAGSRPLSRHRELSPLVQRQEARRAAVHAARFLPRGLPHGRR